MKHWKKWTALLLAGVMAGTVFTGCGKQEESSTSTAESSAAEESSEAQTEAAEETTEATTTTAHISPTETVSTTLGTEIEVNATLDRAVMMPTIIRQSSATSLRTAMWCSPLRSS